MKPESIVKMRKAAKNLKSFMDLEIGMIQIKDISIHRTTVKQCVEIGGEELVKNSEENHKLIKKMYTEGESITVIAKRSGYKESSILAILRRAGLRKKVKVDYSGYLDTWIKMREEGKTLDEMHEATGAPVYVINESLIKAGYRKNTAHCVYNEEWPSENIHYAEVKPLVLEKVAAGGKVYEDITKLFGY